MRRERGARRPARRARGWPSVWMAVLLVGATMLARVAPGEPAGDPVAYVVGFWDAPEGLSPGDPYHGGTVVSVSEVLRFAVVETDDPSGFEGAVAEDPSVKFHEVDGLYHVLLTPDDPRFDDQYGPQQVRAPEAWDTTLGTTDKNVCVVDTGVRYTHEDLTGSRWLGGHDFVNDDDDPWDDHGHGTHVAGSAAAGVNDGVGIAGIANVGLLGVKVLDSAGSGTFSQVASGIQWCADNGGDVINMSLGSSTESTVVRDAVGYAWDRGVLLVAAAGNSGPCGECVSYPAKYDEVIAVACTTSSKARCSFSSQGAEAELAAPGSGILSTCFGSDTEYCTKSGTSMSSPHAAGVAALVWSHSPHLSNEAVRELLKASVEDLGAAGHDASFGHGLVDAKATIDDLRLPTAPRDHDARPGPEDITLTWLAPEDEGGLPVTAYKVYRAEDAGASADGGVLHATLGDVLTYADRTAEPGTTYTYRVSAESLLGEGPKSGAASARQTELPVASFTREPGSPRPGDEVIFTDGSHDPDGEVVAWSWDFGDGATGTDQHPAHTYAETGEYEVTLTVTDNDGARGSLSVALVANHPPTSAFSFAPTSPSTATVVSFLDDSTDSDGDVVAWSWDFADGATSTERRPFHQFAKGGDHGVTLEVTDDLGGTDRLTRVVTVRNLPPSADFTWAPATPLTSDTVAFEDLSTDSDGDVVAWDWNFADGATSTEQHPTHPFDKSGEYRVRLTATDDHGDGTTKTRTVTVLNTAPDPAFTWLPAAPLTSDTVTFEDLSTDSDGDVVSWDWALGDGATSTDQHPTHQYATKGLYEVTLTVRDDEDAEATVTHRVDVLNTPPEAAFTVDPEAPSILDDVSFTDESTDFDGEVVAWDWDFGDGVTSTDQHPTYRYATKGVHVVTLTVTDDDGGTDTATFEILVVNLPPAAAFAWTPDEPVAREGAAFTDLSTDSDGSVVAWDWDFGDGATATDRDPTHVYAAHGLHDVTLTVTDDDGDTDTVTFEVKVIDVPTEPNELKARIGPLPGEVRLSWHEPEDDRGAPVLHYNVYRGTEPGALDLLAESVEALAFVDDTTVLATTYHYAVAAVNKAGEGPASDEVEALGTGILPLLPARSGQRGP